MAKSKGAIVFEEDDEFQDFEAAEWQPKNASKANLWEEDWDKDELTDEFSQQLRAELEKAKQQQQPKQQPKQN